MHKYLQVKLKIITTFIHLKINNTYMNYLPVTTSIVTYTYLNNITLYYKVIKLVTTKNYHYLHKK